MENKSVDSCDNKPVSFKEVHSRGFCGPTISWSEFRDMKGPERWSSAWCLHQVSGPHWSVCYLLQLEGRQEQQKKDSHVIKKWLEVKSPIQEIKSFTFKTGSKFNALIFKSRWLFVFWRAKTDPDKAKNSKATEHMPSGFPQPQEYEKQVQLDYGSVRRTRKINLPTSQKDYHNSKTTVWKLSARRIQIFWVYFC